VGEMLHFLGIDGGGTRCRARLADAAGRVLGQGTAGPANIRFGLEAAFKSVREAASRCLAEARLPSDAPIAACLALAGAGEPAEAAAAMAYGNHCFQRMMITTDARAACVGAHPGGDGGILIVGTGSIGLAIVEGREYRVGGWGFPVSDEGSGAWLGCEALRRTLWAHDGRAAWTPLLRCVAGEFGTNPHAAVRWMGSAKPRDFAALAPLVVEHARRSDAAACDLMRLAALHIDGLAARLIQHGPIRLALAGGLAEGIEPWLSGETRRRLVAPAGDALDGALQLARSAGTVIPDVRGSEVSGTQSSAEHLPPPTLGTGSHAACPGPRSGARGRHDNRSAS
jgi:glucosamine kinase